VPITSYGSDPISRVRDDLERLVESVRAAVNDPAYASIEPAFQPAYEAVSRLLPEPSQVSCSYSRTASLRVR
jgi:hypothetical protein